MVESIDEVRMVISSGQGRFSVSHPLVLVLSHIETGDPNVGKIFDVCVHHRIVNSIVPQGIEGRLLHYGKSSVSVLETNFVSQVLQRACRILPEGLQHLILKLSVSLPLSVSSDFFVEPLSELVMVS